FLPISIALKNHSCMTCDEVDVTCVFLSKMGGGATWTTISFIHLLLDDHFYFIHFKD
ncbi:hypothetical protein ACJX0J_007715, partial [Zea mays]